MTHERVSLQRSAISVDGDGVPFGRRAICVTCKGRLVCSLPSCPLLDGVYVHDDTRLEKEFSGSAPSFFADWHDYPTLPLGPLVLPSPLDDSSRYDNPVAWYGLPIEEIVSLRASLVRPIERQRVSHASALREAMQEISSSISPVDVEVKLATTPRFALEFSAIVPPLGPSAPLESLRLTSNATIPAEVDSLAHDGSGVESALISLYERGHDVYYLSGLLSAGVLGEQKKMLPTSWGITTSYNIVTRYLIGNLKGYPIIDEYVVLTSEYLGTRLALLLMPAPWEYEQLEAWIPGAFWNRGISSTVIVGEHETNQGRSDYAIREGGGYYAVRFGVCEMLEKMRRQAAVLVFEEAGPDSSLPVGAWAHRERVRHATKMGAYSSLGGALEEVGTRLSIPLQQWKKKSIMLNQARLGEWMEKGIA